MHTTTRQIGGHDHVVVSVILEPTHAQALDAICGATLSSRAGMLRRCLVSALRTEGYLPEIPAGRPAARQGAAR